jgi:hypothetical protein
MSTPQDLTLSLLAAGDAEAPGDSGTYLLYEKNNDLFEKLWTGSEVESETYITTGVKKNTPAAYLLKPDQVGILVLFPNLPTNVFRPSASSST